VPAVVGRGLVTVQFDGTGTMAGPPARGRMFDVGSAEASEQSAAAKIAVDVRMAVDGRAGVVSRIAISYGLTNVGIDRYGTINLMSSELSCVLCDISTARPHLYAAD
jgi:hypothetical protein